ncbi:MAG: transglutaminase domain-containing protein [bacterium]
MTTEAPVPLDLPKTESQRLEDGNWKISITDLKLPGKSSGLNASLIFPIELRKLPMNEISSPNTWIRGSMELGDSELLRNLVVEASSFKELPVDERIEKVVALVRSKLTFWGSKAKATVRESNPRLYEWLNSYTDSNYIGNLADVIESGYGICGHFVALSTYLSQVAGLDVVVNTCYGDGSPTNIVRSDNNLPIFSAVPVGTKSGSHTWFEVLEGERCIPVDPTVNLIGTTDEVRKIFDEAGYFDYDLRKSLDEERTGIRDLIVLENSSAKAGDITNPDAYISMSNYGQDNMNINVDLVIKEVEDCRQYMGGMRILSIGNPEWKIS